MNSKVVVLMSVYNGEDYIKEQLISLVNQKYDDFYIYIRDDGSTDGSIKIISDFSKEYDFINVLDSNSNLGCSGSFFYLLESVDADYYFFCDQDDIWLPNKISETLSRFDSDDPTLVHSDLKIVTENLSVINESFYKYQSIDVTIGHQKKQLIVQNYIVGCTLAINSSLRDICISVDFDRSQVVMHDWWISLVAMFFGKIVFLDKTTILYRQHSKNVLGARDNTLKRYLHSFFNGKGVVRVLSFTEKVSKQAKLFQTVYGNNLSSHDVKLFELCFLFDCKHGFFNMAKLMFKDKIRLQGFKRNLAILYASLVK